MSDKRINSDINFGNIEFVSVQSNLIVEIENKFLLYTVDDGAIELKVKIVSDLESVPEKYREVFMNMLTTKFLNKVNFTDNPFSICREEKKKSWWETLKSKFAIK